MIIERITADASQIEAAIDAMQFKLKNMQPLMAAISEELHSQTLLNFTKQGRPPWKPLSSVTREIRRRNRKDPNGKILMVSGQLRASIMTKSTKDTASLSTNKVYAAVQQLGGKAGRNRKVTIPARPYMPFIDDKLQPEANKAVLELVEEFFAEPLESL